MGFCYACGRAREHCGGGVFRGAYPSRTHAREELISLIFFTGKGLGSPKGVSIPLPQ